MKKKTYVKLADGFIPPQPALYENKIFKSHPQAYGRFSRDACNGDSSHRAGLHMSKITTRTQN